MAGNNVQEEVAYILFEEAVDRIVEVVDKFEEEADTFVEEADMWSSLSRTFDFDLFVFNVIFIYINKF